MRPTNWAPTRNISRARADVPELLGSGYLSIPGLLLAKTARALEVRSRCLPARRVVCGSRAVSWEEQIVPSWHQLYRLLFRLGEAILPKVIWDRSYAHCWISRYRAREYIGPHKDKAGTVQLILCLASSEKCRGGELILLQTRRQLSYRLQAGDALIFRATELVHRTTPLVPTVRNRKPRRVVAVIRFG